MNERKLGAAALAAAVTAFCVAGPASAADPARGRALYEARCGGCHNESVHNDNSRKARNFEQARARVVDFSAQLETGWKSAQIDDVAVYLNERYYSFPCPAKLCPKPAPPAKR
jgi:mono/diheme cytochrome c family protein